MPSLTERTPASTNLDATLGKDVDGDCTHEAPAGAAPVAVMNQPMVPFRAPSKSVDLDNTNFWGNAIIRTVFKYDGVFTGFTAGYVLFNPRTPLTTVLDMNGGVLRCRIEEHCRNFFERDIASRFVSSTPIDPHNVEYTLTTRIPSTGPKSERLLLQVRFWTAATGNCTGDHMTTLSLLEMNRTGYEVCMHIPAAMERLECPMSTVMADWLANQYMFLPPTPRTKKDLGTFRRKQLSVWRTLMNRGIYNRGRCWDHVDPRSLPADWTCVICQETCGDFCSHLLKLPCGHIYHPKCFGQLEPFESISRLRCPLCLRNYNVVDL
jgi:hypothetical protein